MVSDNAFVSQPWANGRYLLFDAHAFRNAVSAHMAGDENAPFTLVVVKADRGSSLPKLDALVLRELCLDEGDLAGRIDDAVAIYMHGDPGTRYLGCISALRSAWRAENAGELLVVCAVYPREEDRVIALLTGDWRSFAEVERQARSSAQPRRVSPEERRTGDAASQ